MWRLPNGLMTENPTHTLRAFAVMKRIWAEPGLFLWGRTLPRAQPGEWPGALAGLGDAPGGVCEPKKLKCGLTSASFIAATALQLTPALYRKNKLCSTASLRSAPTPAAHAHALPLKSRKTTETALTRKIHLRSGRWKKWKTETHVR